MIGPVKKKMPDMDVCSECDVVASRNFGGTEMYPKRWTAHYCYHPDLKFQVAVLRKWPFTPDWCPAKGGE